MVELNLVSNTNGSPAWWFVSDVTVFDHDRLTKVFPTERYVCI